MRRNALTRNFKHYYLDHVCVYWVGEFSRLPSYNRFLEWMPSTLLPLCVYLKHCFGHCTAISFIDATSIKVCHHRTIPRHRVFQAIVISGKNLCRLVFWCDPASPLGAKERAPKVLNFTL